MIDFENEKTWPSDICDLIFSNVDIIKKEKDAKEKHNLRECNHLCSIETPILSSTLNILERTLSKYEIKATHCTKLIDFDSILYGGLKLLTKETILTEILRTLSPLLPPKDISEIINLFDNYENDKGFENRQNMIWFVLTEDFSNDIGCQDLFKYYGGEVTRRILYSKKDKYYPLLEKLGKPCIVQCKIPIKKVAPFQLSNIANELVDYGINKIINNSIVYIKAECNIQSTVIPSDIIAIKEKNYLR